MALATSNCVINGQKSRGGTTYGTAAVYLGHNGTYYEYCMSFTTGDFTGTSNSITFNIRLKNSAYASGTTSKFRYALLTSDANVQGNKTTTNYYYETTKEDVGDPNQITSGVVSFPDMKLDADKVLTIETDVLQPNTNYYLVIWPYQTQVFCTVSSTQYHGAIVVEYEAAHHARVYHYLKNEDGTLITPHFDYAVGIEIGLGASWTPTTAIPPDTHTADGATFKAWTDDWSAYVGGGVPGVDYITVNSDIVVEVYYPTAGSYIYYNDNGTAIKCEVYYNNNGQAIRCEVYYNNNGSAVKM